MTRTTDSHRITTITGFALGILLLSGCAGQAPASSTAPEVTEASEASEGPFDLEALVEAAQAEGPITIYDSTSKIESMAEAFTEKYGIQATGVKSDAAESIEKVTREAQAGNVVGDVVAISDLPALSNQLLPNDFVYSWVPDDLVETIDEGMRDPLVLITDPAFWTYNTEVYDSCPVSNMWELTTPEYNGRTVFQDPVGDNGALDWYSQMGTFGEDELHAAYEEQFGEPLTTEHDSAAAEWVSRLAANSPILSKSSEEASEAVGAPGQSTPPIGLMSSAKHRNIDDKGYALGVCEGMEPWVGKAAPKGITIATGSENQNAARLFVHFALTQEGIEPQIEDGKISSNSEIVQPEDPAGVGKHAANLFVFDNAGIDENWDSRQEWQDLWRTSRR